MNLQTSDKDTTSIVRKLQERYIETAGPEAASKGKRYLCENLVPPSDLMLFSGKGVVLESSEGKFYDFSAMSLNCILGQNDEWVNANLVAYILSGQPSFATTSAGTGLYYEIAEEIAKLSGMDDAVVDHRQCNGSDVTELAIVAAYKRKRKGQKYVVSFKGSYHGQNLTSYAVSDLQQENRFLVDDEVSTVFLNTPTHTQPADEQEELSENDKNILNELARIGERAFAVIIEPIQVNNRVNISSKIFLKSLKELCVKLDVPLIFDDIQTGYGWLGTFSSTQFFGVQPNMMAVSKAITSGYGPLAALVMDREYGNLLPSSTVRKTNGADMRSLAAAKAVIERLRGVSKELIPEDVDANLSRELEHGLLSDFSAKEAAIKYKLVTLQEEFPKLFGELRGTGLIWSLDVINVQGELDYGVCAEIQKALLERGVLVRDVRGALLFKLPITFTDDALGQGFKIVHEYLRSQ